VLSKRGRTALDRIGKAAASYRGELARKLSAADLKSLHANLGRLIATMADIDSINPAK
jgi:hypothetical protein